MLKDKMKNLLIRYLFALALYFIISVIFKNLISFDKTTFIVINIAFIIMFLITYIKYQK